MTKRTRKPCHGWRRNRNVGSRADAGDAAMNARLSLDPGRALAEQLFASLREATGDGVGITRDSYGAGESAALDIVEAAARGHGLQIERDAAGNLVVTLPGTEPRLGVLGRGPLVNSR